MISLYIKQGHQILDSYFDIYLVIYKLYKGFCSTLQTQENHKIHLKSKDQTI